jgi:tripartite-type tricarboxylate transporter receptor subunit TctC
MDRRAFIKSQLGAATALALGSPFASTAQAAGYPDRLIKLIVPYPPGGSTDPVARILAADVGRRLGQQIIVENKAGAAGSIATEFVVRAPADGYTLLLHTSAVTTEPSFKKTLPYDIRRDLTPITIAAAGPYLMVIHPSLPVANITELIAYAKANPGKLNYGSAGIGSSGHIIGELFKMTAGIDMVHVAYKGGGPSVVGLMANEVQLVFDTVSTSRAFVEAGRLRALAVTSPRRAPLMPNVPTVSESGLPGFSTVYWLGIFAPAKVPQDVVDKLSRAFKEALLSDAVKTQLDPLGIVVDGRSPGDSAKLIDTDIKRWKEVIERARIEAQ